MPPDAEDCEELERLKINYQPVPVHGRRILPEEAPPAQAWTENEELDCTHDNISSPGESRRLLSPPNTSPKIKTKSKSKSHLQDGLSLGVWGPKKGGKSLTPNFDKSGSKSKFQKRRGKIINALKPPYFILTMIVIIVCMHLWGSKELKSQLEWAPGPWWRQPWRIFTYGCLHANASHLALNALVALTVGWQLEREQGWWRVVAVWWGGVAAGALGAGVLQSHVHVVGASAAVYALLTAHLPNVCLRFGHIPLWWFRPLSVLVLGASEWCGALLRAPPPNANSSHDHVAWAAHAFGAVVGIPIAFLVFSGENSSKRVMLICRVVSAVVLAAGVVVAAVHYAYHYEVED